MFAVIEDKKLTEYLLSAVHPLGKHKARVFASWGYSLANKEEFKKRLLAVVHSRKIVKQEKGSHGINYTVHGRIKVPIGGFRSIKTGWTIEDGKRIAHLAMAVPI